MDTTLITWSTIHQYGPLWLNHHKLRKTVFVDGQGWDIPHSNELEWDQYDTPLTTYVITHVGQRVIAAARIVPCTLNTGYASYMIRDAALGRLPHIPPQIIERPSVRPNDYEITRFTVDQTLPSAAKTDALEACTMGAVAHLHAVGAERAFALMPPAFARWFRKIGVEARRVGPLTVNDRGERFCVLEARAPFAASALPEAATANAA